MKNIQLNIQLKVSTCENSPEEPHTERIAKYEPSGHSCRLIYSFDSTKNKYRRRREEGCAKRFCEDVREFALEVINYEEK